MAPLKRPSFIRGFGRQEWRRRRSPAPAAPKRSRFPQSPEASLGSRSARPAARASSVSISYSDATFVDRLDSEGHYPTVLDCFAGEAAPITITFEDGTSVVRQPVTDDLARYSKVAIVWSSSVDLDLHAFEYAARRQRCRRISGPATPLSFAEAETNRPKRETRPRLSQHREHRARRLA